MSKNSPTTRRILELTQERDAARLEAENLRHKMDFADKSYETLNAAVTELRKQLEDMRRQRDAAYAASERAIENLELSRLRVARLMGWVDAKLGEPPRLDMAEIPF